MAGEHDYVVRADPTVTFGRVILHARDQHLVVDGPVRNGCPGEAVTPAELFLGGVASCAVELIQVIGREQGVDLDGVEAEVAGTVDRGHVVRSDLTVFSSVSVRLRLPGLERERADDLARAIAGR